MTKQTKLMDEYLERVRGASHIADLAAERMRYALDQGATPEYASSWADNYSNPPIIISAQQGTSKDEIVNAFWRGVFEADLQQRIEIANRKE
jgi:hypothetical protein